MKTNTWNRLVTGAVATAMLATLVAVQATPVSAATAIKVTVDGTAVAFPDQKPMMDNNRVLIPTRFVAQQLGGKVDYNNATKVVTIKQGEKTILLKINSAKVSVNGKSVTLDVPAKVVRGRTMVPLRFVSEGMGAYVDWNQSRNLVAITTNASTTPPTTPPPAQTGGGFQFDPGFTTLAKELFINNMVEENGQVTFTVPTNATASFNTNKFKETVLTPGKTYTFPVGKDKGFVLIKYVDPAKVVPGAPKQSEYYTITLDPSLAGYSDTTKVIITTDDSKLNKKKGTLPEVIALASKL